MVKQPFSFPVSRIAAIHLSSGACGCPLKRGSLTREKRCCTEVRLKTMAGDGFQIRPRVRRSRPIFTTY